MPFLLESTRNAGCATPRINEGTGTRLESAKLRRVSGSDGSRMMQSVVFWIRFTFMKAHAAVQNEPSTFAELE